MRLTHPRIPVWNFLGAFVFSMAVLAHAAPTRAADCRICCRGPWQTLSEQYARAQAAVLGQWISAETATKEKPATATYEIVDVARTPVTPADNHEGEDGAAIEKGKLVTLERYRAGKKGDLVLLLGQARGGLVAWDAPVDISSAGYTYFVEAPTHETPQQERLAYYLKFLEHPDHPIADDAHCEFAHADYKDIAALAKQFPRESLRKWLTSPDLPVTRTGLYGIMLGLCGTADDAALLRTRIMASNQDFRLGIDGVMFGYVLLMGEPGLSEIEEAKLQDKQVVFSETYAVIQTLRNLWKYGEGRISGERLKTSLRRLVDRPELADLVIGDLTRWKDWSLHARLMEMYGADEYNLPCIKRAIIRYMIASSKDVSAGGVNPPQHATDGARCLQELRTKDAKMVNDAERYFFLQ